MTTHESRHNKEPGSQARGPASGPGEVSGEISGEVPTKVSADVHAEGTPAAPAPASTGVGDELVCQVGDRVGQDFVILGLIGCGGIGQVYRALHETMYREVAIKVLAKHCRDRADVVRRFLSEMRALAEIRHPNIVEIYHSGRDPKVGHFIAMALLPGKNLRRVMTWVGQMNIEQALGVAIDVCEALRALHEGGIIHRDTKPENIVLDHRPGQPLSVTLIDLGGAHVPPKYDQHTTQEKNAFGTAAYMSPEHVRGERVSAASDIYSAGVMLYEMLAAVLPFGKNHPGKPTQVDYWSWQLHATPTPLTEIRPGLPEHVWHVIQRAIAKDPAERWASAVDFSAALGTSLSLCIEERRALQALHAQAPQAQTPQAQTPQAQTPPVVMAIDATDAKRSSARLHATEVSAEIARSLGMPTAPAVPWRMPGRDAGSPTATPRWHVTEPMPEAAQRIAQIAALGSQRTEPMPARAERLAVMSSPRVPTTMVATPTRTAPIAAAPMPAASAPAFEAAAPTTPIHGAPTRPERSELRRLPPLEGAARDRAIRFASLIDHHDGASREELERGLRDPHPIVRRAAARSLESIGDAISVGALHRAMAAERDEDVRTCFEEAVDVLDPTHSVLLPPVSLPPIDSVATGSAQHVVSAHALAPAPAPALSARGTEREAMRSQPALSEPELVRPTSPSWLAPLRHLRARLWTAPVVGTLLACLCLALPFALFKLYGWVRSDARALAPPSVLIPSAEIAAPALSASALSAPALSASAVSEPALTDVPSAEPAVSIATPQASAPKPKPASLPSTARARSSANPPPPAAPSHVPHETGPLAFPSDDEGFILRPVKQSAPAAKPSSVPDDPGPRLFGNPPSKRSAPAPKPSSTPTRIND